jgi:hypothetical protein
MNPVFWLLIIILAVVLWFIISFVFIPLGSFVLKKWNKTLEILNKEIENNDEKGEK